MEACNTPNLRLGGDLASEEGKGVGTGLGFSAAWRIASIRSCELPSNLALRRAVRSSSITATLLAQGVIASRSPDEQKMQMSLH